MEQPRPARTHGRVPARNYSYNSTTSNKSTHSNGGQPQSPSVFGTNTPQPVLANSKATNQANQTDRYPSYRLNEHPFANGSYQQNNNNERAPNPSFDQFIPFPNNTNSYPQPQDLKLERTSTTSPDMDSHSLRKPKSKLRLRLKLTPPHPPGTKLAIPTEPLPLVVDPNGRPQYQGQERNPSGNGRPVEGSKEKPGYAPVHAGEIRSHAQDSTVKDNQGTIKFKHFRHDSGISFGNSLKTDEMENHHPSSAQHGPESRPNTPANPLGPRSASESKVATVQDPSSNYNIHNPVGSHRPLRNSKSLVNLRSDLGQAISHSRYPTGLGKNAQGEYDPIPAQARAHQAYQRSQIAGTGSEVDGAKESGRHTPQPQLGTQPLQNADKVDQRRNLGHGRRRTISQGSTHLERVRSIEEANDRRKAPSPPVPAKDQPPRNASFGKRIRSGTIIAKPAAAAEAVKSTARADTEAEKERMKFYQLKPTPVLDPITVDVPTPRAEAFAPGTQSRTTSFDLNSNASRRTSEGESVTNNQPNATARVVGQAHMPTRDLALVADESFDHSQTQSSDAEVSGVTESSDSTRSEGRNRDHEDQSGSPKGKEAEAVTDIFSLSDQMLSNRLKFIKEIGCGNWGSVWACKTRSPATHPMTRHKHENVPAVHPAISSQYIKDQVAVKLVHRAKSPTTAAKVRALWSEMKVIRALRGDPHPNIVGFDAFVITPSYALVIMPNLPALMPVGIPENKARGYFKQLASAIAYLHDNGITHNDIKPANILISHSDAPVVVDFGFAQKWEINGVDGEMKTAVTGLASSSGRNLVPGQQPFWSEISWGTPEYLDPLRAKGRWHDERLSDVWALGITFFEILIGRTPFELTEDEEFDTQEQLDVYYERTLKGDWLGEWSMSLAMERLLRAMVNPHSTRRLTASQALNNAALMAPQQKSNVITTPPFVRTAAALPTARNHKHRREAPPVPDETRLANGSSDISITEDYDADVSGTNQIATDFARQQVSFEQSTPSKSGPTEPILIISPNATQTQQTLQRDLRPSERSVTNDNSQSQSFPSDESFEAELSGDRTGENAMSAIEALGRVTQALGIQSTPKAEAAVRDVTKIDSTTIDSSPRQATIAPSSPPQTRMLKRPASAMDLRSEFAASPDVDSSRPNEKTSSIALHQRQNLGRQDGARRISQNRRHTRIVSEGCLRSLIEASSDDLPPDVQAAESTVPAQRPQSAILNREPSQATLPAGPDVIDPAQNRDSMIRREAEKLVRFRTASGNLLAIEKEREMLESLRDEVDPAALESRLNQIASWVKSVEQIVLEARTALEEVQMDRARSPADWDRPVSRLSNRHSIDNLARMAQANHHRTASAFASQAEASSPTHWKNPTQPLHRPSMSMETAPSYHLRRQRSDLTNFRSMQFQPIVEQELDARPGGAGGPSMWANSKSSIGLDRKLRSHRSTGDLNKLAAARGDDPYDGLLSSRPGVSRVGDGWGSARVKSKSGFGLFAPKEERSRPLNPSPAPPESRFKKMFRGILKR